MMREGPLTAIGLMSGTSMDGIDVAMLGTDGVSHLEFRGNLFVPYEAAFRRRLEAAVEAAKAIVTREQRPGDLAAIEREITTRHADAVFAFLQKHRIDAASVDLVGFHGQTVLHRPHQALTVQLGDGGLLARSTGIPVVYDMRANDMRHGGQGAPLVPAYHTALARSRSAALAGRFPVCFVNIGGISNITFVPERGDPVAFDTGPGNALIDQWVALMGGVPFDAGGAIASEGSVVRTVVERYLANPFFSKPGPKSLDRADFTIAGAEGLDLADGARTLASITAESILKSVDHLPEPPRLWILCGGGRKNPHILSDLRAAAEKWRAQVLTAEDLGMNGDFTEAEAWAHLAVGAVRGLPLTFPTTTGCREPATGGVITLPPAREC